MPRHSSAASSTSTRRRLTFSFDSSGWLYAYHLGAAHYIQTQCMPELSEDELAFSGSSGGALVACALCTGISIAELACYVVDQQPECKFNPWRMLPCAEAAVDRFLPERAAEMAEGRLRVLLTRVQIGFKPLLWPEAVSHFGSSNAKLKQVLRASCHIPVLGGLLPFHIPPDDGAGAAARGDKERGARYYDGLFWPSVLYTWRAFHASDTLLKVPATSALSPPALGLPPALRPPPSALSPPPSRPRTRPSALGRRLRHRRSADAARAALAPGQRHRVADRACRAADADAAALGGPAPLAADAVAHLRARLPRHRPLLV